MDTMLVNGTHIPTYCREKEVPVQNLERLQRQVLKPPALLRGRDRQGSPYGPAVPTASFPARWPTDGRAGGVPNPKKVGPP